MPENIIDQIFALEGMREKIMRELSLSKQTMSDWKRAGGVPARHAVAVEKMTGIPRERLCPGFDWGRKTKAGK